MQHRTRRGAAVASSVALLLLVAVGSLTAAATAAPRTPAVPALPEQASAEAAAARAEHQRIVAYWTPERMRDAKPREMVVLGGDDRAVADATDDAPEVTATAATGGTVGTSAVSGANWTGGTVQTTTGRVFFTVGNTNYYCSGSTVNDGGTANRSIVLTAAHCAYNFNPVGFVTNWLFVPDWASKPTATGQTADCANTAYGCWSAKALVISRNYANAGTFGSTASLQNDFAFAVVFGGGFSPFTTQLDSLKGLTPPSMVFSGQSSGTVTHDFGYPAYSPFDGTKLVYCNNTLGFDTLIKSATYRLASCPMTEGSSGGPWFRGFNTTTGTGTIYSVNSYIRTDGAIYGPKFNSTTSSLFNAAKTATANRTV